MSGHIICLDIGTYSIKGYNPKNDHYWQESNCYLSKHGTPHTYGSKAEQMEERLPAFMELHRPMSRGIIRQFGQMMDTIDEILSMYESTNRRGKYLLAVPTDVSEVEKRAFSDLLFYSKRKASNVLLIERGIAEGLGCGIDLWDHEGSCVLNLASKTDITVLSGTGITINRSLPIGFEDFIRSLQEAVLNHYGLNIGELTAKRLLEGLDFQEDDVMITKGRSYITGYPDQVQVQQHILHEAITPLLQDMVSGIHSVIIRASSDVVQNITKEGIYLCGGNASIKAITQYLQEHVRYPLQIQEEHTSTTIRGLSFLLKHDLVKELTYSMLEEDYRWLR